MEISLSIFSCLIILIRVLRLCYTKVYIYEIFYFVYSYYHSYKIKYSIVIKLFLNVTLNKYKFSFKLHKFLYISFSCNIKLVH